MKVVLMAYWLVVRKDEKWDLKVVAKKAGTMVEMKVVTLDERMAALKVAKMDERMAELTVELLAVKMDVEWVVEMASMMVEMMVSK